MRAETEGSADVVTGLPTARLKRTIPRKVAILPTKTVQRRPFWRPILKVDSTSRLKRSLFGQTFSRRLLSHVSAKTQNRVFQMLCF